VRTSEHKFGATRLWTPGTAVGLPAAEWNSARSYVAPHLQTAREVAIKASSKSAF
jgi:hypothetical protein